MRGAGTIRSWVIGILLAWLIVFAASFIVPRFVPPTGEGFMYGFNRIEYWFWLQVTAFVLAVAASVLALVKRTEIARSLRLLTLAPLAIGGAVAIFLASIIY